MDAISFGNSLEGLVPGSGAIERVDSSAIHQLSVSQQKHFTFWQRFTSCSNVGADFELLVWFYNRWSIYVLNANDPSPGFTAESDADDWYLSIDCNRNRTVVILGFGQDSITKCDYSKWWRVSGDNALNNGLAQIGGLACGRS